MLQAIIDRLATLMPDAIVTPHPAGESIVIMTGHGEFAVTCTMTGKVRLESESFGPVTVSGMSKGTLTVAQDILTAIHFSG